MLDLVRSGDLSLNASLIDLALDCIKRINRITEEVAGRGPIKTVINDLIHRLKTDPQGKKTNVVW